MLDCTRMMYDNRWLSANTTAQMAPLNWSVFFSNFYFEKNYSLTFNQFFFYNLYLIGERLFGLIDML